MATNDAALPRIVILGAGLGGTIAAFEIKDAVKNKADVSVISDSEHFSFTPSNPWVALRWREPEAIQIALRPVFDRKRIGFIATGAKSLLPDQNCIELDDGNMVDYDYHVEEKRRKSGSRVSDNIRPWPNFTGICWTVNGLGLGRRHPVADCLHRYLPALLAVRGQHLSEEIMARWSINSCLQH